jgi:tetratricopeptide (TPR) repeat protein
MPKLRFPILLAPILTFALAAPLAATCGGGGGGGLGGAASMGGGSEPTVYRVPWQVVSAGQAPPSGDVAWILYWLPISSPDALGSGLQTSRTLTLASARCVAMVLVDPEHAALRKELGAQDGEPLAVLTFPDGRELGRVLAKNGKLVTTEVDKLVDSALDRREKEAKDLLAAAEKKSATDKDGAAADLQRLWGDRCLLPSQGKKAAKLLKKLGVAVDQAALESLGPDQLADPGGSRIAAVEPVLLAGLKAELAADYEAAGKNYRQAAELDPGDATALRFLGEFYRHHTGEWDKATVTFRRLLAAPADPVSRAVAQHGLGKMTIHGGKFADGLALFEQSIATWPLPITYRNLAVYWFSEKETQKAAAYTAKAAALDPHDRYNQIFAAVYLAVAGKHEEARQIAVENENLLEASYNLAAIWAQLGDQAQAMRLLKRHFYEYERYEAVRAMEMREARDDYMFAAMHGDPAFVELTALATRFQMMH